MKQLLKTLQKKKSTHILIIGDVMVDQYIVGNATRLSPEAPVPIVKKQHVDNRLGGAAHVALNCYIIGCEVDLIGVVGANDSYGEMFCSLMEQKGLSLSGIVKSCERSTTIKTRVMDKSHQLLRIDHESKAPLSHQECENVMQRVYTLMRSDTTVVLSDYAKGVLSSDCIATIIATAHQRGCTIIADPKGPLFLKYKGVHYLKPNEKEFYELVCSLGLDVSKSIIENARVACARLALDGLIITRGEKGIIFVSHNEYLNIPAQKLEVYDITGAGDTVAAYCAFGLSHGCTIKDVLMIANQAASLSVQHVKTYAVSLEELLNFCDVIHGKYCSRWSDLKIELDWLRREGKRVVLTNGCFDIIHAGHISLLHEARQNGDILVVALNSDSSIKKIKGESRPINTLKDRITVMAALDVVDFIVTFEEETPLELIKYLKPDVLIKGGDYQEQTIVGYEEIKAYGGNVKVCDFVPGKSTTKMINKLNEVEST